MGSNDSRAGTSVAPPLPSDPVRRVKTERDAICSARYPDHLVLASSTSVENSAMLECWLGWVLMMLEGDRRLTYEIRVERRALNQALPPRVLWYQSLKARIRWMQKLLLQVPECAVVLFTDPDVMPVSAYSRLLLPAMLDRDVVFQPGAYTNKSNHANAGFTMLRNSWRARMFLQEWLERMGSDWNDQVVLNSRVLMKPAGTKCPCVTPFTNAATGLQWNLSWDTWPTRVLAATPSLCATLACVAFHAVLHGSGDSIDFKLRQLAEVSQLRKSRGLPSLLSTPSGTKAVPRACLPKDEHKRTSTAVASHRSAHSGPSVSGGGHSKTAIRFGRVNREKVHMYQ